ncbi:hypothetical protein L1887_35807 [Cichorium endivia]|nr:hypothetical protein L1887_35807 [Cichorium endivia]
MALSGKLIGYVEITSGGDVFHDFLRHKPHEVASIFPDKVHGCDLVEGQRGDVGSTVCWNFTLDGEKKSSKQIIEAVDEEKHMIVLKVVEGFPLEGLYKSFTATFHVEPKGDGKLATWTFEYEKLNAGVPYPTALMDFVCTVTKDLDVHTIDTSKK